jgi:hypothetical protein
MPLVFGEETTVYIRPSGRIIGGLLACAAMIQITGTSPAREVATLSNPTLPGFDRPYISVVSVGCFPAMGTCISGGTLTLIRVSSAAFGASDQDIILNVRQSRELTTVGGSKPMGPLLQSGNIEQEVEREGTDHLGTLATEPLASF